MKKQEFLTEKMTGFFGVRIYKEGTPMENRKIKVEDAYLHAIAALDVTYARILDREKEKSNQ